MTGKAKIIGNIKIGKGAILEAGVIIGLGSSKLKTIIGENAILRANTIICAGVRIGDNFETGPAVFIRENNKIGNNVCIWAYTVLNPGNCIGNNTRIHVGCFLEEVTLGKFVFVAPHVTFLSDPHPTNPPKRTCMGGARVEDGAIIGGNVTLLPHVVIGREAVIGAGSVVTKNVEAHKVVVGNPARVLKSASDIKCMRNRKIHYPYR
ncbi:MAG: acetyltransferase [Microgenomates group bacterium Gr01-1014_93]|nr:MAG: acetyltransferase [Microgenomates group bacterium Gr01-1014_93]